MLKKGLAQVFSCEFCEILKNNICYRTPPVAASKQVQNLVRGVLEVIVVNRSSSNSQGWKQALRENSSYSEFSGRYFSAFGLNMDEKNSEYGYFLTHSRFNTFLMVKHFSK